MPRCGIVHRQRNSRSPVFRPKLARIHRGDVAPAAEPLLREHLAVRQLDVAERVRPAEPGACIVGRAVGREEDRVAAIARAARLEPAEREAIVRWFRGVGVDDPV